MGILSKKYRLFWITDSKEIIGDYKADYSGSITMYPDESPNSCFESDDYQDILDKINTEGLKNKEIIIPPIE